MAVIIELIAAQYFLQLDKKLKQVEDLKAKQLQIGNQLIALESNGYISIDDKKTLRSYYLNLQNEYQIQISKIIDTEISQDEKR
jgi:phage anti-repressor protein